MLWVYFTEFAAVLLSKEGGGGLNPKMTTVGGKFATKTELGVEFKYLYTMLKQQQEQRGPEWIVGSGRVIATRKG